MEEVKVEVAMETAVAGMAVVRKERGEVGQEEEAMATEATAEAKAEALAEAKAGAKVGAKAEAKVVAQTVVGFQAAVPRVEASMALEKVGVDLLEAGVEVDSMVVGPRGL